MKFYPRLSLACPFEIVEVGGDVTAVSVSAKEGDFSGVIRLKNDSAQFMFKELMQGITLPELVKACMEQYSETDTEEVQSLVLAFLDMLKEKKLLSEDIHHGIEIDN